MSITYQEAEQLAVLAHGESVMDSGSRFIDHVRRVAAHFDPVDDLDTALAAILHDAVEKGTLTFDDLRRAGVTEHVIVIVDALTERDGEPEGDYLARCIAHTSALRIKRVDIADKIAVELHGIVDPAAASEMRRNAERRMALLEHLAAEKLTERGFMTNADRR